MKMSVSRALISIIVVLPWILLVVWSLLMVSPSTRSAAQEWMSYERESNPVEILTASFFLIASVLAFVVASRRRSEAGRWSSPAICFVAFSFAALLIFLEEISYGQHLIGFEAPDFIAALNQQNEVSLHNLHGLHGNAGKMYLVFTLAAFIGLRERAIWPLAKVFSVTQWGDVRVPTFLTSLTFAIFSVALAKVTIESVGLSLEIRKSVRLTTEWAELFIAIWALCYAASKLRL